MSPNWVCVRMTDRNETTTLWSTLRRPDSGWLPRLGASLISGLVLTAAGLLAAWWYAIWFGNQGWVDDDYVAAALGFAGFVWLVVLTWIWRGQESRRRLTRAFVLTVALALATAAACVCVDIAIRRGEEFVIAAVILLGSALAVWIWTPVLMSATRGRSPRTAEGEIDVRCPTCGYALNGLRDLRCPECGTTFTIDSLIEAQRYDGGGRVSDLLKVG